MQSRSSEGSQDSGLGRRSRLDRVCSSLLRSPPCAGRVSVPEKCPALTRECQPQRIGLCQLASLPFPELEHSMAWSGEGSGCLAFLAPLRGAHSTPSHGVGDPCVPWCLQSRCVATLQTARGGIKLWLSAGRRPRTDTYLGCSTLSPQGRHWGQSPLRDGVLG